MRKEDEFLESILAEGPLCTREAYSPICDQTQELSDDFHAALKSAFLDSALNPKRYVQWCIRSVSFFLLSKLQIVGLPNEVGLMRILKNIKAGK